MKGSKRFRTLAVILVSDFCFHDFVLFRIVVYFVYIIRLVDVMCTKVIDPVCLIQKKKKNNLVPVVHETTKNKHFMISANDGERCFTRTFTTGNNYQHSGFSCPVRQAT